jgi:hypothetical protein
MERVLRHQDGTIECPSLWSAVATNVFNNLAVRLWISYDISSIRSARSILGDIPTLATVPEILAIFELCLMVQHAPESDASDT